MAEQESIDDFLSSEIDENAVNALVGSLETQLATPANTQVPKTLVDTSFNNNHLGIAAASSRQIFLANQTPIQKGTLSNNGTLSANTSVSTPKLTNSDILGISSIISSSSTPVSSSGVSHLNVNSNVNSNGRTDVQRVSAPAIRMVTQSTSLAPSTNTAFITSGGNVISQTTGATNNVHAVPHGVAMGTVARTNVTAANSTLYNLTNTISEQKPVAVVHNGSAHPIQVTKDLPMIPQQGFVVKQEGGTPLALKQDGTHTNQHLFVKTDGGTATAVHIKPDPSVVSVAHSGPLVNTALKGVAGVSNPSIVVRAQHQAQQVAVMQQPTVVTTQANMTQPVHVVNVSGTAGTPRLPNVSSNVMKPGMRTLSAAPVRITHQPNIAPRQPGPPGSGSPVVAQHAIFMRSDQGQIIMLAQAGQPGGAIHQNASTSVPITSTTAFKIQQRPATSVALTRPGTNTIVIQPGGARSQPITLAQPQAQLQAPRIISQPTPSIPAPSIAQPQPAVVATSNAAPTSDQGKLMLENVKKCKNFLSTLLRLASNQPPSTVKNVQELIQGLIDAKVEPEMFTQKLQHELKSSPQPYLVPFLKKSLPLLRQCMLQNRMSIENIRPPPPDVVTCTSTTQAPPVTAPPRQQIASQPATVVRPPTVMKGIVHAQKPAVVTAAQIQTKPVVPQAIRPPLSQLGPASSKVLMQTSKPPPSPAVNASRIKTGTASAVAAATMLQTPSQKVATQKVETSTTVLPHREKRKFEALKDDNDDINDVATMGGVNLSEESKNILATNSELIGSQIRSCQDKMFLPQDLLMSRIVAAAKKQGLEGVSPEVSRMISHATEHMLRDMMSKLSNVAEHRMENYRMEPRYEMSSDVRLQLKFLEELNKAEKKRHEEHEREILLRAIKSRSKNEDPEQIRLKQRAKELQQAEAEEVRQREANLTALAAIGPRKKRKADTGVESSLQGSSSTGSLTNGPSPPKPQSVIGRPRIKRVSMKDLQFVLESDSHLCKSPLLYRTFLK